MLDFELQNHRPLRELVYEELKHKILIGNVNPGTRLMEIELAESMGVSRTPIREAIRKLEKEGLVSIEPRRGAYVSDISIKDMVDILEVREDLEGLAASLAARRINEEEASELKRITEKYSEAIISGNTDDIVKYDEMFHKLVVSCSGNRTLMQMVGSVQELALRFRYLYYDDYSRYEDMPGEHTGIMEAIINGDEKKARDQADLHIKRLKNFLLGMNGRFSKK
ncbi:MAG: GntR family transcriptional regulator [Clostridiales bacterium]|jgi:DNA-binding GntR family transcriptional regulator|nr:GntR family transcriptional regulator [Clostridiales bacterium]